MPEEKTCFTEKTPMNDDGRGNAVYLDRHVVKCPDYHSLARFKLHRNNKHDKFQYEYTCCRTNKPVGTTSMPSTTELLTTIGTTIETTSFVPGKPHLHHTNRLIHNTYIILLIRIL